MLHVYTQADKHVAMINKPPKIADNYRAEEPWCLLHNTGRVDRFETAAQAREEAMKTYGRAKTPAATPALIFELQLAEEYRALFATPQYALAAKRNTPAELAAKMTRGLVEGTADKDGEGVKRTCKALGIKPTYKAIAAYMSPKV